MQQWTHLIKRRFSPNRDNLYQSLMDYLSAKQLVERLEDSKDNEERRILVVDVRQGDFAGGNVRGALNVPSDEFEDRLDELMSLTVGKNRDVVFHCMLSQVRGPSCCNKFIQYLYNNALDYDSHPNVYLLKGGFSGFVRYCQGLAKDETHFESFVENYSHFTWGRLVFPQGNLKP